MRDVSLIEGWAIASGQERWGRSASKKKLVHQDRDIKLNLVNNWHDR